MATFHVKFASYTLRMATDLNVIIPSSPGWSRFVTPTITHKDFPEKLPCLYLLHGFSGDYSWYISNTRIEEIAQQYKIAVVMPSAYNSAWEDEKYGIPVSEFLTTELIEFVERMFPVSSNPKDRFIAGFSMGGYGAMLNAIRHPELYDAVASISGTLIAQDRLYNRTNSSPSQTMAIYGDPAVIDPDTQDIFVMLENAVTRGEPLPRIYACSGTEDTVAYPRYQRLLETLEKVNYTDKVTLYESEGIHDGRWNDKVLPMIVEWMLNRD
ncbi:MAG: hypothetical protein IIZ27_03255 [Solobacterium sp.]|nr:hypothetical protein [Solobacterium sp.]